MPLYELLEELFSLFEMNRIKEQDAYLFAFFDAVTDYLQNNIGRVFANSSDIVPFCPFLLQIIRFFPARVNAT